MSSPIDEVVSGFTNRMNGNATPVPNERCSDEEVSELRAESPDDQVKGFLERLTGQTGASRTGEPAPEEATVRAELAREPITREPGSSYNPQITAKKR